MSKSELKNFFAVQFLLITIPIFTTSDENFTLSTNPNDIHFYLHAHPREPNHVVELKEGDVGSLKTNNFHKKQKTVFLIHGFISNYWTHMPVSIRNAYLQSELNYNIITVDWGLLSVPRPPTSVEIVAAAFPFVVQNLDTVAHKVAAYITFLSSNKVPPEEIHLVGHSLGAHICGFVGAMVKKKVGKRIGRISGLDPSGPRFQNMPLSKILDSSDALFVDVYHTNMGIFGYLGKMGHVDFYPNGGRTQPGCFGEPICSHNIAVEVFAETINRKVEACKCRDFIDFLVTISCDCDFDEMVFAGEFASTGATNGHYYYTTSPAIRKCRPLAFNC